MPQIVDLFDEFVHDLTILGKVLDSERGGEGFARLLKDLVIVAFDSRNDGRENV